MSVCQDTSNKSRPVLWLWRQLEDETVRAHYVKNTVAKTEQRTLGKL